MRDELHLLGALAKSTGNRVILWAAAEVARLREERRWIPVGERLPPVQGEDVLVAQGPWDDGSYSLDIGWWNGTQWMFYGGARDTPPVAFWQTLPQPPSEEEVEG